MPTVEQRKKADQSGESGLHYMGKGMFNSKKSFPKILRLLGLFLMLIVIIMSLVVAVVATKAHQFKTQFESTSGMDAAHIFETIQNGWSQHVIAENGAVNILVLGLDQVDNRAGGPILTDTILLVSVDTATADVSMISFPRDIWDEVYQTKINALYSYGEDFYPGQPQLLVTETLERITGVPIHHTVVISLEDLSELIDIVGGIEVTVDRAFVDTRFPRDDVDISIETDPAVLYKTVAFEQGPHVFDGETALAFIRSRNSKGDEGTDIARSARQQKVLEALISTTISKSTLINPNTLGKLVAFYQDTFERYLPMTQLVAIGKNVLITKLDQNVLTLDVSITKESLPIQTATQSGVLYHPPVSETNSVWVYQIVDEDAFKQEVQALLGRD